MAGLREHRKMTMGRQKDISHFSLIDWDFQLEDSRSFLHDLCWYPSRFIPVIPAQLIAALSKPYDVVLDPFCGAGTTVVEALKTNRTVIGCDLSPVAHFLSSVKSRILLERSEGFGSLQDLLVRVRSSGGPVSDIVPTDSLESIEKIPGSKIPNFEENSTWFHKRTLQELAFLFLQIEQLPTGVNRDVARAIFLGILNYSSGHKSGRSYTYADNVKPKTDLLRKNAIKQFARKLSSFLTQHRLARHSISPSVSARIYCADVRRIKEYVQTPVNLIVTSPPYLNVTDYSTGFRLAYLWYDFVDDLSELKRAEIGPRWRRHYKHNLEQYILEMDKALQDISDLLQSGGYFCLVLGEPKKYYDAIKKQLVNTLCTKKGLILQNSFSRQISKKHFLHPQGGVPEEEILILRK